MPEFDNEELFNLYESKVLSEALIKIPAVSLQPGDKLALTGGVVLGIWSSGLHIPPGKVMVQYRDKRGETKQALWNKNTMISVERP